MTGMTLQECQEARAVLREQLEQAQTEIKRLKAAIATARAELDIVERYFLGRVERATPREEAHLHTVLNAPMKAIVKAQAALAEEAKALLQQLAQVEVEP